jgi:hypothetical protein
MWTLARDIASATKPAASSWEAWDVDPITRKVYVQSVTALLNYDEAATLRETYAERRALRSTDHLSDEGRALAPLLSSLDRDEAEVALSRLPAALRHRLDALSPSTYVEEIRAPLIVLLHDRDDPVVPVAESRALRDRLSSVVPARYTEFTVFRHLDPGRSRPSPLALGRELLRFARALYPLFRQVAKQ